MNSKLKWQDPMVIIVQKFKLIHNRILI